jgi:hypothetical protein
MFFFNQPISTGKICFCFEARKLSFTGLFWWARAELNCRHEGFQFYFLFVSEENSTALKNTRVRIRPPPQGLYRLWLSHKKTLLDRQVVVSTSSIVPLVVRWSSAKGAKRYEGCHWQTSLNSLKVLFSVGVGRRLPSRQAC